MAKNHYYIVGRTVSSWEEMHLHACGLHVYTLIKNEDTHYTSLYHTSSLEGSHESDIITDCELLDNFYPDDNIQNFFKFAQQCHLEEDTDFLLHYCGANYMEDLPTLADDGSSSNGYLRKGQYIKLVDKNPYQLIGSDTAKDYYRILGFYHLGQLVDRDTTDYPRLNKTRSVRIQNIKSGNEYNVCYCQIAQQGSENNVNRKEK